MKPIQFVAALLALAAASAADAAPRRNDKIYAAVEANRQGALDLWQQIVNIDSGTGDVAGGAKIRALLTPRLTAIGGEVRMEKAEAPGLPDNLVAVFHGSGKGRILVIAHVDTVFEPGSVARRPFKIAGDRLLGPGVGDEKGGVITAVTALKILHDTGFRNFATITLLLETSEERGSSGTLNLIKALALQADVEFNMESGDPPDVMTVWRKGSISPRIHVKGRAAHAGVAPQDGRNAAVELVHQLTSLNGAFPLSGDGTTVNLTLISAGSRANIIPEDAEATFSLRYRRLEDLPPVLARMRESAAVTQVPDTVVTVIGATGYPPLVENAQVDGLALRAEAIYGEIGKTIGRGGNGGASESAVVQAAVIAALDGLGPVGSDFHTDHEWVDLNSLTPRLYLITRLLMETGAKPPGK